MLSMTRSRMSGFSLPELLVVMFVITLLATGTFALTQSVRKKGQITKVIDQINSIGSSMTAFNNDTGFWPNDGDIKVLYHNGRDLSDGVYDTVAEASYPGLIKANVRGPYTTLAFSEIAAGDPRPLNPFGGTFNVRYNCAAQRCSYGVVVTNIPYDAAEEIDIRIDGAVDGSSGAVRFGDASGLDSFADGTYGDAVSDAGRTNLYVELGLL